VINRLESYPQFLTLLFVGGLHLPVCLHVNVLGMMNVIFQRDFDDVNFLLKKVYACTYVLINTVNMLHEQNQIIRPFYRS
jgi:hypothetical protein